MLFEFIYLDVFNLNNDSLAPGLFIVFQVFFSVGISILFASIIIHFRKSHFNSTIDEGIDDFLVDSEISKLIIEHCHVSEADWVLKKEYILIKKKINDYLESRYSKLYIKKFPFLGIYLTGLLAELKTNEIIDWYKEKIIQRHNSTNPSQDKLRRFHVYGHVNNPSLPMLNTGLIVSVLFNLIFFLGTIWAKHATIPFKRYIFSSRDKKHCLGMGIISFVLVNIANELNLLFDVILTYLEILFLIIIIKFPFLMELL